MGGRSELAYLDAATGKVQTGPTLPFDLPEPCCSAPTARRLCSAVPLPFGRPTSTSFTSPRGVTRLTESRHDGVDLAQLVRPELILYTAHDGLELSGWLYRPQGTTGPLPTAFVYHGGPECQGRPTMSPDAQALVANGIAVFFLNVRGSSGFGKAFMAMDDGAKRVDAVRDIESTTEALVAMGIADPARLGIMGGSYGGYMVTAGVTEFPTMFAAVVNLFAW